MIYLGLAAIIAIIAALLVYAGFKTLVKPSWVLAWLRGTAGMLFLLLAIFLGFSALDFYSYKQLEKDKSIVSLSFTEVEPQLFRASVIDESGREQSFELRGDLWQLDVRLLSWAPGLSRLGLLPGYRLDRLSGRYVSLEEEKNSLRTIHALYHKNSTFDVWAFLKESGAFSTIVKSGYGSATYLPMKDGALYAVKLTHSGLAASPLNDRAKMAVENWL